MGNWPEKDSPYSWDKPGKVEHYEKRFGIIAIEKGFIAPPDLVRGLTIQVNEDINNKPHRLLGEIFFSQGLMTDRQVEDVLSAVFQKK